MNLRNLFLSVFILTIGFRAHCQGYNPNIDFELGNTSNWNYYIGTCCPIITSTITLPLSNRHDLTSGSTTDPYGGFPVVSPDGGSYSLKLGNDSIGAEAEKARYYIHVPAGVSNYSLIYRYAVVFQDPGHTPSQQPRFVVSTYDSVTSVPIPCAQFTYVADSILPGFHLSSFGTNVYYKSWSSGSINLSGLSGTTITIDFATGDCALGGHFGYGYIDMSSGLFAISTTVCDTDSVTLNAPAGYNLYAWYDSTSGLLIDTQRVFRIHNPPGPITLKVILLPYPGYGCPDTLYSRIIPSHLVVLPGYDTSICPGDTAMLSVTATDIVPLRYAWTHIPGLGCDTCSSTTATTPARYVVTVSNTSGCSKADTFNVRSSFTVYPMNDIALCKGDSRTLTASASGVFAPFSYIWSPAVGLSCSTCAGPVANPSVTTTYIVAIKDSIGCTLYDTVRASRDDLTIVPGPDGAICQYESVTLSSGVTGSAVPLFYNWSPGTGLSCVSCGTPLASPPSTTIYYVTITDSAGCTVKDTINVRVGSLAIAPLNNAAICSGTNYTIPTNVTTNAAPVTYSWLPAAGLNATTLASPVAEPTETTDYLVIVTDTNGCTHQATITITVDTLSLDPIGDTTLCLGFPHTIYANAKTNSAGLTYAWAPGNGLSCTDCADPVVTVNKTTGYTLVVTDSSGCTVKDDVLITIDPCDIHFPNAFTPNGDGKNDIIRVLGHLDYFKNYSMSLYNRWGERVFYSEDIYSGWDGIYNGSQSDLGTYFYMIIYSLYGQHHMMKGDFELIR